MADVALSLEPARPDTWRPARSALRILRRSIDLLLILLLSLMVLTVMAQVVARYVFNRSIVGADEVAGIAQVWMVLLGAGYAMRARLHVSIDMLVVRLPNLVARALLVPVAGISLWFLWVVFEGGLRLMELGAIQSTPGLGISMEMPYAMLPIGAAYLAFEACLAFGAVILGLEPVGGMGHHGEDAD